jgi:sugar O-acyltransferase (sialic acid O-acetyltransferase NeuD family)
MHTVKRAVVFGASGHGRVVADILHASNWEVIFWDEDPAKTSESNKVFLAGKDLGPNGGLVMGIGDNRTREKCVKAYPSHFFIGAVHPASYVANTAVLGVGSVVMAQAVIHPNATIGEHCIINTGAIVEHDCTLNDFVHVSPGAVLAGNVAVEKGAWIGAGAVVKNGVRIGPYAVVGAGAVVVKDVAAHEVVVGNPAKPMPKQKRPKELILVGSGGWSSEVLALVEEVNRVGDEAWEVQCVADEDARSTSENNYPLVPFQDLLDADQSEGTAVVIAIADPQSRARIARLLKEKGYTFPNFIHPSVHLPVSVKMGEGNVLAQGTIVSPHVTLGNFNVVNFQSILAHHAQLGDCNTLAPRVQLSGRTTLGHRNELGTGVVLLPGVSMGDDNEIIAAGVLDRTIHSKGKYGGIPVKRFV